MIPDGHHLVAATCPHCGRKVGIPVSLTAAVQIDTENGSQLKLRARTKPVAHDCDADRGEDLFSPDPDEPDTDDDPEPVMVRVVDPLPADDDDGPA